MHGIRQLRKVNEMLMNDSWILGQAVQGMITPFSEFVNEVDGRKVMSYGLSSYGYDARLSSKFMVPTNIDRNEDRIDPKNINAKLFSEFEFNDYFLIPAHGFVLAHTVEKFKIPDDVLSICVGKSTYARCGLVVNVTPLEPGWEGYVTLELSNTTNIPLMVHVNEGICQFLFFKGNEKCETPYNKRSGKYMNQVGVTLPKM